MSLAPIIGKNRALYERLVADIRSGRYPPGTRLPSEWNLVDQCGVSRTTVRRALDALVADGLIVRQRGQATWVHADALERLTGAQQRIRRIHVVLTPDKAINPIYAGILDAFHEHLPERIRPTVFFEEFAKPGGHAEAAVVVVDGGIGEHALAQLRERGLSLVVVNRMVRGLPCVCTDNRLGGMLMAQHVLERGHRAIGILHFGEHGTEDEFVQRVKGIRAACARAGVVPAEVAISLHHQNEFTPHQAVERLLRMAPDTTVILCVCDLLAYNVVESLAERTIRIPEGIGVIGFDDLPHSRFTAPPLTTVRQPVEDLGEALAKAVTALADGHPTVVGRPLRPQLVPRQSCPLRQAPEVAMAGEGAGSGG